MENSIADLDLSFAAQNAPLRMHIPPKKVELVTFSVAMPRLPSFKMAPPRV